MLRNAFVIAAAGALVASFAIGAPAAESTIYDQSVIEQGDWNAHNRSMIPSGPASGAVTQVAASCGAPASTARVDRQIELRPGTKYVNVTAGETVMFKVGGKSFTCKFDDTLKHSNFDLAKIAPKDIDVKGIRVYCQPTLYERAG